MVSSNRIPEDLALRRGLRIAYVATEVRLLVCVYARSLALFDSCLVRLIPVDILMCILACVGSYVVIYGKMGLALRLFWHFLGFSSTIGRRTRKQPG